MNTRQLAAINFFIWSLVPLSTAETLEDRVIGSDHLGPIDGRSSLSDVKQAFGADAVEASVIPLGEGTTEEGFRVLKGTPSELSIIFGSDFRSGRFRSERGQFAPVAQEVFVSGKAWRTQQGAGIGSSAQQIEEANGKVFTLAPFETDGHGQVASWNGGKLEGLNVRFSLPKQLPDEDYQAYVFKRGDKPFRSSDSPFLRMNPSVAELSVRFHDPFNTPVADALFTLREGPFNDPDRLEKQITSLAEPWDRLMGLRDAEGQLLPMDQHEWQPDIVIETEDFAVVHIEGSAQIPVIRRAFSSATLLLEPLPEGAGFHVRDLISRSGVGYNSIAVNSLTGLTAGPMVHMRELIDATRRTGTWRHQLFRVSEGPDGNATFSPALTFTSRYTQAERDESCELSVGEKGELLVEVTHQWPAKPDAKETKQKVTLPWNEKTGLFNAGPLENLVGGNGVE